jgi:hypothetical protein
VPWTTGAGDEEAGEEDEAGADDGDPDLELAAPEVPGAGCEPAPTATAGAVLPPGPADGATPRPPAPGDEPWPRDGAPRLFATTPGPALPRAPAAGGWDGADPPPMTRIALTVAAAAAVAALAARA